MSPPRFRRPTGAFPADGEDVQTPQPNALDAHTWHCWGTPEGPGAQRIAEVRQEVAVVKQDMGIEHEKVRGELSSIKSRISWFNGGTAVLSAIGMVILAAWLSSRFQAAEANAVKPKDVAAAVQKSADMAVAKQSDDFMQLKQQLDQASVDFTLLKATMPMPTKAHK